MFKYVLSGSKSTSKYMALLIAGVFAFFGVTSVTNASLIISQYTETESGSTPKGIELWNNSGADIDLSQTDVKVWLGRNGDPLEIIEDLDLSSGIIPAGGVIVIGTGYFEEYLEAQGRNVPYIYYNMTFNGDDALGVSVDGVVTDIFGEPGNDPGSSWNGNGVYTSDANLQLKSGINSGDLDGWDDPSGRFETVDAGSSLEGFGFAPGEDMVYPFDVVDHETFNNYTFGGWTAYNVASNENWGFDDYRGRVKAYINNYNGDVPANDWLISQEFDMSIYEKAEFSFYHQKRFNDYDQPYIFVKLSHDYPGYGNPEDYDWMEVYKTENDGWGFSNFDLTEYAQDGPFYLAVQYTSTMNRTQSNSAASWYVDDLMLKGFFGEGNNPVALKITKVMPEVPMAGLPFSIEVRPVDNQGRVAPLQLDADVMLKLFDGSNTISGNMEGTLKAGQFKITFDNLTYPVSEEIRVKAIAPDNKIHDGQFLADGEMTFVVSAAPTLTINTYSKGHAGVTHPEVRVEAIGPDGQVNPNYTGYQVDLMANPAASGTMTLNMVDGMAIFDDIMFDNAGNYELTAMTQNLGNSAPVMVNVINKPAFAELVVPNYIKGEGSFLSFDDDGNITGGNGRMPNFALVQMTGLHPNTVYRFASGVTTTIPNNEPLVYTGGRQLTKQYDSDDWAYLSSGKDLEEENSYSTIMADGQGNATFWINVISDNDADMAAGNDVNWLVELGFENGHSIDRFYTNSTSETRRLGAGSNDASGIYDAMSDASPKNFIVLLDANDEVISTALVNNDGAVIQTPGFPHQSPPFYADYEWTDGAWATIIPNDLAGGVRTIREHDAQGNLINVWTDGDGVWAGFDTRDSDWGLFPENSGNEYAFALPYLELNSPMTGEEVCNPVDDDYMITWEARGTAYLDIYISQNGNPFELLYSNIDARDMHFMWDIVRERFKEIPTRIRVESIEHPYANDQSGNFMIYDAPMVTGQTDSKVVCEGDVVFVQVEAEGSNLTYQWYKDGKMLMDNSVYTGSDSEILYINGIRHRDAGVYTARVSGAANCAPDMSEDVAVYIATDLGVYQPSGETTVGQIDGGKALLHFEAHVNGAPMDDPILKEYEIRIQWFKLDANDNPVEVVDNARYEGAKSNYLTVRNFQDGDEGRYFARIWGHCGEMAETPIFNLVKVDLVINTQPADVETCEGEVISLTVDAATASGLTIMYQWYKDGTPLSDDELISGTMSNELTINNSTIDNSGEYTVRVWLEGGAAEVVSNSADVNVKLAPIFVLQPRDVSPEVGNGWELEVLAEGENISYQWYKDGEIIDGATGVTYGNASATEADAGVYTCVATNECGQATSAEATVTVGTPPLSVKEVSQGGYMLTATTPNPVSTDAFVTFSTPSNGTVKISLVDETGREVASLVNGFVGAGEHNLDINAENLTSGVYFIILSSGDVRLTQSMVVTK